MTIVALDVVCGLGFYRFYFNVDSDLGVRPGSLLPQNQRDARLVDMAEAS
jgi:hypothetical protein